LGSYQGQDFALLHGDQTGSEADVASYPVGTWALSPRVKRQGGGVKLTTDLNLVPRSRKVELYLHFPICLHGILLN
jgi:hypothetical protein